MRAFGFALLFACAGVALPASRVAAADPQLRMKPTEDGVEVTVDGKPFATYRRMSGHQPVIWPIIGPGGQAMTRSYPLGPLLARERDDHGHHRSLWFNHGQVNGLDFWMEAGDGDEKNLIAMRGFGPGASDGEAPRIVTTNDWTTDGKKVCEDERTITFGADEHGRWIDLVVDVRASEGPVVFGDTKEGSFGLRVPGTMSVTTKQGGRILNSRGMADGEAWGRAAEWVDYRGPVDGQPAGVTIFDLPDSFRHPCRWHVRDYGLFAANPFGQSDFPPSDDKEQGAFTLAQGDALHLHYRVLFHRGDLTPEQLAAIYENLAKTTPAEPAAGK